ncbi:ATP-binding protein [Streptomyces albidoflavus]|uniref:ATP-binding protein n=1 Tax=Streptomyces albidoflavus TaxID=1886 RepID=UPI00081E9CA3|nr:ATP-binding protein [Streptomyces albidoflavus]SCE35145.1 Histidine kinase-, DNA gyrase B-, and HSP90-like ATPase [Streptomyces sp. IgraMP-1]
MTYELAPPAPVGMVASLSSLGYSLPDALADLVDNSVSAGARTVEIDFSWAGRESWMAITDDGRGMSPETLVTAMTVAARGPATDRSPTDLGRYGVGLKSASFSQCRLLTVSSATDGDWITRTWDLDVVEQTGEWRLLHTPGADTSAVLERVVAGRRRGTVVLWQRLSGYRAASERDKKTQQQFYDEAEKVRTHLGLVFARFLGGSAPLSIEVAGVAVAPWDPFVSSSPSLRRLPPETLPLDGRTVFVEPFVLPGSQRLTPEEYEIAGGPHGWLRHQGFYVYRRDRLILAGSWLGLRGLRREERFNLARVAVDIPAEMDAEWRVDVRKATVVPPVALRRHLTRIGQMVRREAADTVRHRGQIAARQHSGPLAFAWNIRRTNGRISCKINRHHPLVEAVLKDAERDPAQLRALLHLLEETVPVPALRVLHETDSPDDPEPFGGPGPADDRAIEVARQMYKVLQARGNSADEATALIRSTQPFDQLDGFWSAGSKLDQAADNAPVSPGSETTARRTT